MSNKDPFILEPLAEFYTNSLEMLPSNNCSLPVKESSFLIKQFLMKGWFWLFKIASDRVLHLTPLIIAITVFARALILLQGAFQVYS